MKSFAIFLALLVLLSGSPAHANRAIAILLDVSKSIPPEDFAKARKMATDLANGASPQDQISIFVFGSQFRKVTPEELATIEPTESYTLLYDSAFDVARNLQKTTADRKAILIVTDGLDTKSATVLEDTVRFADDNGIAIYGIGLGKVNRKSLERISKLTGGKYFSVSAPGIASDVTAAIDSQDQAKKAQPPVAAAPAPPPVVSSQPQAPVSTQPPVTATKPAPTAVPSESGGTNRNKYLWIAGGVASVVLLTLVILFIASSVRKEQRLCPTCGRVLDAYQTICQDCAKLDTTQAKPPEAPADSTQEFGEAVEAQTDEDLIPVELLEKRAVSEESLTKTFVLMETPMLVVRKGKNLGQSFALNRAFPVSIGRSRVNEIRLDDITVSGQHCRIIPENGRHVLYDLGSTNGTLVNEKKATKVPLKEGDIIKVGETQFLYKVEQHRG